MIVLTFNDGYSGIYRSQVIDVARLLNETQPVFLVCFISWRLLKANRSQIKKEYPNSLVLPILAGLGRWKINHWILRLVRIFKGEQNCIARGPFAAGIAKKAGFDKIIYDGRAAVKAEIEEFDVIADKSLRNEVIAAEKEAVLTSNHRIAVSQELVSFWENEFGYSSYNHTIIPSTLSKDFEVDSSPERLRALRLELGYGEGDLVFCFSGGNGGWNSLEKSFKTLRPVLKANPTARLLLLTSKAEYIDRFIEEFPNQVKRLWLKPSEVKDYLAMADYGLLIRDDKVTNNVASPVKFAEYLGLGLSILISDNVKDYASFVAHHRCGVIFPQSEARVLIKPTPIQKAYNKGLAEKYLMKSSELVQRKYNEILMALEGHQKQPVPHPAFKVDFPWEPTYSSTSSAQSISS